MQHRTFGKLGWKVSQIGMGTWALGSNWGPQDDADSIRALQQALDSGCNFIDTARAYGDGRSERVIAEANDGPEYLYISFDIDVLDPAYTPGTGTPENGGLTPREVFPLVRGLCTEKNIVGFDLVELNPLADPGYTSILNANRIVQECLTGIAMRKKGITDGKYLNPLTSDDARSDP